MDLPTPAKVANIGVLHRGSEEDSKDQLALTEQGWWTLSYFHLACQDGT